MNIAATGLGSRCCCRESSNAAAPTPAIIGAVNVPQCKASAQSRISSARRRLSEPISIGVPVYEISGARSVKRIDLHKAHFESEMVFTSLRVTPFDSSTDADEREGRTCEAKVSFGSIMRIL
jgi:hypothetical protein